MNKPPMGFDSWLDFYAVFEESELDCPPNAVNKVIEEITGLLPDFTLMVNFSNTLKRVSKLNKEEKQALENLEKLCSILK